MNDTRLLSHLRAFSPMWVSYEEIANEKLSRDPELAIERLVDAGKAEVEEIDGVWCVRSK